MFIATVDRITKARTARWALLIADDKVAHHHQRQLQQLTPRPLHRYHEHHFTDVTLSCSSRVAVQSFRTLQASTTVKLNGQQATYWLPLVPTSVERRNWTNLQPSSSLIVTDIDVSDNERQNIYAPSTLHTFFDTHRQATNVHKLLVHWLASAGT